MKIFISWSGSVAKTVADGLRRFLEDVNHHLSPWMSQTDIVVGTRWANELSAELEASKFGIVCVTHKSQQSPWVLFEAGALSKSVAGSRVCPYLIGVDRQHVIGPLSQFQCVDATKASTLDLLKSINSLLEDSDRLSDDRLRRYFDRFWPDLEIAIANALQSTPGEIAEGDRKALAEMIISCFDPSELEMQFVYAGLPREKVNWKQAMLHITREVIDVAIEERRLMEFLALLAKERPGRADFQQLVAKVQEADAI